MSEISIRSLKHVCLTTTLNIDVVVGEDTNSRSLRDRRGSREYCDQEDKKHKWRDHDDVVMAGVCCLIVVVVGLGDALKALSLVE